MKKGESICPECGAIRRKGVLHFHALADIRDYAGLVTKKKTTKKRSQKA